MDSIPICYLIVRKKLNGCLPTVYALSYKNSLG